MYHLLKRKFKFAVLTFYFQKTFYNEVEITALNLLVYTENAKKGPYTRCADSGVKSRTF